MKLHDTIRDHAFFRQWTSDDTVGVKQCNKKLLLLGALRYIGRAWIFDDIKEAIAIYCETNHTFSSYLLHM